MRILVPFDFTKTSEKALLFALQHCNTGDSIECIHTIGPMYVVPEIPVYINRDDVLASAKQNMEEVVSQLSKAYPVASSQIKCSVVEGPVVSSIFDKMEVQPCDLVVMGTHDKETLFDRILGSNSNSVASLSDVPVVMVHGSLAPNYKINKILFAFDAKPDLTNALKQFLKLNKAWNAPTDFVHINTSKDDVYDQFDLILKKCYIEEEVTFPINVNVIKAPDAVKEIEKMVVENGYDLIVMVKDNSGLFSGYFKPSFSINTVHKIDTPVLILKEKI
jgi:nucleotide-binding universal stress UspA family protein